MPLHRTVKGQARFLKREVSTQKAEDGSENRVVRGFASMEGVDRQGDDINPNLFDLDTYMKNGALYVNHKLWTTKEGNEVSAGVVREAFVAKVAPSENDDEFKIVDIETGEQVDTVPRDDRGIVDEGDVGLWVKAEIMEPAIIKLVDEGRLNAFSWAGDMLKSGVIDLMEISLVYVGANSRALVYAKALDTEPSYLIKSDGKYTECSLALEDPAFSLTDANTMGSMYYVMKEKSGMQEMYALTARTLEEAQWEFLDILSQDGFSGRCALLKNTLRNNAEGPVLEILDDFTRRYAAKTQFWTEVYVNNLPDIAFAYIEKGGQIDEDGLTTPRSLRHFPIQDHRGNYDKTKVMDAINVAKSHPFGKQALGVLQSAAEELGLKLMEQTGLEGGELDMTNEEVEAALGEIKESMSGLAESIKGLAATQDKASVEDKATPAVEKKEEVTEPSSEMSTLLAEIKSLKAEIASMAKGQEDDPETKEVKTKAMTSKAATEAEEDAPLPIRERERLTPQEVEDAKMQTINDIFTRPTRDNVFAGI